MHRLRNPGLTSTIEIPSYSWSEQREAVIENERIFRHKVFRVNYTSYDIRRCQDTMNPRTQANIMLPAPDLDPKTGLSPSGHPFMYARILGVFHADVIHNSVGAFFQRPQAMEFLWVRWYRLDSKFLGGFKKRRLHRLELIPADDPSAFGFVDPDDVIRGTHLIPAFAHGHSTESTPQMVLWKYYYVNLYVVA